MQYEWVQKAASYSQKELLEMYALGLRCELVASAMPAEFILYLLWGWWGTMLADLVFEPFSDHFFTGMWHCVHGVTSDYYIRCVDCIY